MFKKIAIAVLLLALIGVGTGIYMWNKPHKKAEDTKGIGISAAALVKAYMKSETDANTQYLNKAIEVSGTISEIEINQDGGVMVIIATDDPTAGVQCAMRDKTNVTKGQQVRIKGFCSGSGITGVSLTDCVVME